MVLIEENLKKIEEKIQSLPSRLNFKIGEASKFLSTPTHVLRYWEREFSALKSQKFTNNQRLYTRKDISTLLLIKTLLHEEKFSTQGLKKHLPYYLKQMRDFLNKIPKKTNEKIIQEKIPFDKKTIERNHANLEQKAQDILITLSKIKNEIKTHSF